MRILRTILFSEDYGELILIISNLTDSELRSICIEVENDIENGIGRTTEEIAHDLFPNCIYKEIFSNEENNDLDLDDYNGKYICNYSCFGFYSIEPKNIFH